MVHIGDAERHVFQGSSRDCWLKRADVHAIQSADVVRVNNREALLNALNHFHDQNIEEVLIQDHIDGEVIKFYGIGPGEYFNAFMVSSEKSVISQASTLLKIANRAAETVGLEIYGGDAVLTPQGRLLLIDLNDWPSFSACCQDAARSIAEYVDRM